MSKKTKLIIGYIIVMIIILVFGAVSIYMYLNNQVPTNIDMNILNNKMAEEASFNSGRMQEITKENVTELFNIPQDKVKEVIGKVPLLNISSGMYVVIHTEKENVEQVEQLLINYGNDYENKWSTYMEDQYELVKQRKIGSIGNYVYMIVYETPDDMIKYLKEDN